MLRISLEEDVYIDPTHHKEDDSTGKRISKDHSWRIAEVSLVQKVSKTTIRRHLHHHIVVWEGCREKASSVNQLLKSLQFA